VVVLCGRLSGSSYTTNVDATHLTPAPAVSSGCPKTPESLSGIRSSPHIPASARRRRPQTAAVWFGCNRRARLKRRFFRAREVLGPRNPPHVILQECVSLL
jgi:hypothetical protein